MPYKEVSQKRAMNRRRYQRRKADYRYLRAKYVDRNRQHVSEYLKSHPCIVCGEQDIVVLEFDHRDPAQKECNIAEAVNHRCFSLKRLVQEMEKCDVLCANCHRRKTAIQLAYQ